MEPLYPVDAHPLLSAAAGQWAPEVLAAQTVLAEQLLGLTGTTFTGADAEQAAFANVLQVNLQASLPADVWIIKSETRGARSVTYRDGINAMTIQPQAKALADALLATTDEGSWAIFAPKR